MEKLKTNDLFDADFERAIDEQFQILMKDDRVLAEISRLKATPEEVKEHIALFMAFKDDQDYCATCPGLDSCAKNQRHYQIRLERNGRFIERSYAACPLLMKQLERDSRYWISDFDEEWKTADRTTIDGKKSRLDALTAAASVLNGSSKRWLFLTGGHRVGKSYLMVAFVNELLAGGYKQAAVISASTRFKELLDTAINDKPGFKTMFDRYASIDILAIDDFGNEFKSDFLRDQIVYPLLLERAKNDKITLFTSDFKISEIGTLYATSDAGKIRSRQFVRLLKDYCQNELEIGGMSGLY